MGEEKRENTLPSVSCRVRCRAKGTIGAHRLTTSIQRFSSHHCPIVRRRRRRRRPCESFHPDYCPLHCGVGRTRPAAAAAVGSPRRSRVVVVASGSPCRHGRDRPSLARTSPATFAGETDLRRRRRPVRLGPSSCPCSCPCRGRPIFPWEADSGFFHRRVRHGSIRRGPYSVDDRT